MDEIDKKLLNLLQINNRLTSEVLGEKVGLSPTACQRRLKKLRSSQVISKEIAVLNSVKVGGYVTVIVEIVIKQGGVQKNDGFKQRMLNCPSVQQCYYVAGDVDFILIVTAKNMLAYEQLTRSLFLSDDNIKKFHSIVVMDNVKTGLNIPI